jgi:hypothetical protein
MGALVSTSGFRSLFIEGDQLRMPPRIRYWIPYGTATAVTPCSQWTQETLDNKVVVLLVACILIFRWAGQSQWPQWREEEGV